MIAIAKSFRPLVAGLPATLLLTILSASFADGPVIDQEHVPNGYIYSPFVFSNQTLAQTFTVGLPGKLTNVDLRIFRNTTTTLPFVVELRKTNGFGAPDVNPTGLLASIAVDAALVLNNGNDTAVDLGNQAFTVQTGSLLAIVLKSTTSQSDFYMWATSSSDATQPGIDYLGGQAFGRSGSQPSFVVETGGDRGFRTYVTAIPEPHSWHLLVVASCTFSLVRRARARCAAFCQVPRSVG